MRPNTDDQVSNSSQDKESVKPWRMSTTWKRIINHAHMDTLSSTKEARRYNGFNTISLTSGAGNSVQPLVKEWNYNTF